jgi:phytoene desaturase
VLAVMRPARAAAIDARCRASPACGERLTGVRVVVIGSGFGGSPRPIRLQQQGHEVTILEKRDKPGGTGVRLRAGRLHLRRRADDHHGAVADRRAVRAQRPAHERLRRSRPIDPFYNIRFEDGSVFRYTGDRAKVIEQIRRFSPDDVEATALRGRHRADLRAGMALIDTPFDRLPTC